MWVKEYGHSSSCKVQKSNPCFHTEDRATKGWEGEQIQFLQIMQLNDVIPRGATVEYPKARLKNSLTIQFIGRNVTLAHLHGAATTHKFFATWKS